MQTKERTMTAITQHTYGSSEQMHVAEVPLPQPAPDEVLIEVHAAGVDRGVWHVMTGKPYLIRVTPYGGLRGPKNPVPGSDVAGRVVAVGSEVTRFAEGDEVFGIGVGAFAEYAVAKETKLVHKPNTVSFDEAGTAAVSGITALQALTETGRLEPGQSVLVIGAAGGVGSFAVQIARALGGIVTGVASGEKLDLVRALGASDTIDYRTENYLDGSRRWDLIIDTGGSNPVSALRRALHKRGTLVIVGGEGGNVAGVGRQIGALLRSIFVKQRLTSFISAEKTEYIQRLADLMADGAVRPAVGSTYSLQEAPQAVSDLTDGAIRGKAAVLVRTD